MNAHKIGSIEAIALVCIVMTNQILLNMPESIIRSAGSSAWLNVIFVSLLAIGFTLLVCKLFQKFTGKDILDVSKYVGGKGLQFIIGIAYIGLFIIISSTLLQYFSEYLKVIYFPRTPIFLITALFLVGVIIANRAGIKAISNVNLGIIPIVLLSMLLIFLSTAKEFKYERLFPILGHGINTTFFSGLTNLFSFGGIAFLYFIMPFLKNCHHFKRIAIISIIISSIYLFLSVTSLLLVFSFIMDTNQTIAIYSLARTIEYGRFFQRTDALFILLWILLLLSYLSIVVALVLHIFKKISNVSNPKVVAPSFSLLIFSVGLISSDLSIANFLRESIYRYYELGLVFIVSFIILCIANVKIRRKPKKEVSSS